MLTLNEHQVLELKERHRQCRERKECDRIKAVLLCAKGWSLTQIAEALLLDDSTIGRHIQDYLKEAKLSLGSGGAKRCHLNEQQTAELIEHLSQQMYHHQKDIVAYANGTYGVNFTVSGINKWLHQHGFVYKRPKGTPHKFDEALQTQFIDYYEELKASLKEDERLLFMDAVHPTQATKINYGWIRKGEDKPIPTTGSRTRMNLIGAIELNNFCDTVVRPYATVNAESLCDFLERLRSQDPDSRLIHMFLDQAGYHRSEKVKQKAKELGIKLHYLPPYSPNLNPIERLWKVMNQAVRNNRYFKTAKEFRQAIERFFSEILPDIADTLENTINDNFERLKPAV